MATTLDKALQHPHTLLLGGKLVDVVRHCIAVDVAFLAIDAPSYASATELLHDLRAWVVTTPEHDFCVLAINEPEVLFESDPHGSRLLMGMLRSLPPQVCTVVCSPTTRVNEAAIGDGQNMALNLFHVLRETADQV